VTLNFTSLTGNVLVLTIAEDLGNPTIIGIPQLINSQDSTAPASMSVDGLELTLTYDADFTLPVTFTLAPNDPAFRYSTGSFFAPFTLVVEPVPTPPAAHPWYIYGGGLPFLVVDIQFSSTIPMFSNGSFPIFYNQTTGEYAFGCTPSIGQITLTFPSGVSSGDIITRADSLLDTWFAEGTGYLLAGGTGTAS
jgi:hypothetical protein